MPALSQSETTCRFDVSAPPDIQIKDCSLLIQSNAQPGTLSDFYMIRGRAFNAKQDYDWTTITHWPTSNEATHSNPQSVAALTVPGDFFVVHTLAGQLSEALADCAQALHKRPGDAATLNSLS